jgi:hypothetical protein
VLRFFNFIELANASVAGVWVIKATWHVPTWHKRFTVLRLLLARPLWWLAVRLLAVPDADVRYTKFRARVLARWEDFLLG